MYIEMISDADDLLGHKNYIFGLGALDLPKLGRSFRLTAIILSRKQIHLQIPVAKSKKEKKILFHTMLLQTDSFFQHHLI